MNAPRTLFCLVLVVTQAVLVAAPSPPSNLTPESAPLYKLRIGDRISIQISSARNSLTKVWIDSRGEIQIEGVATPVKVVGISVEEAIARVKDIYQKNGSASTPLEVNIAVVEYAPIKSLR